MNRLRFVLLTLATAVLWAAAPSGALAGGWAVTTLDPLAADLTPGTSVAIGYTIRQHGQRPVDLADTGIELERADGTVAFFPGAKQGSVGHYVATVEIPLGTSTWTVRQGWFGPQDLGALPVAGTAAPTAPGESEPGLVTWLLLTGTILSAIALVAQLALRRRPLSSAG